MIIENKYEAMAPYVETAQNSAQRMNALVNFIRSADRPVTTRELNQAVLGGANLAKYLLAYDVIATEIKAEEFRDVEITEWVYNLDDIKSKTDTEIIIKGSRDKEPIIISNYTIKKVGHTWYSIEGTRKVQVRRKYWFWKV